MLLHVKENIDFERIPLQVKNNIKEMITTSIISAMVLVEQWVLVILILLQLAYSTTLFVCKQNKAQKQKTISSLKQY